MDKPISSNPIPGAAAIIVLGAIGYAIVGEYSVSALIIAVIAGILGVISFTEFDKKLFEITDRQINDETEAFEQSEEPFQDFDDIWEALQDWYQKDPRNGELVYKKGVTKFDTTVPNSVDGKFRFMGLVTPSKDTDEDIYCCVELSTKSLLTWDERGEVNRDDLPGECQLIEDLRDRNRVSVEETRRRIMNSRTAQLGAARSFTGRTPNPAGFDDVDGDTGDN